MTSLLLRSSRSFLSFLACSAAALAAGCGDGSSTTGGPDSCEAFVAEPARNAVQIKIVNTTKANIYLGTPMVSGCVQEPELSILGPDGKGLEWYLRVCALT